MSKQTSRFSPKYLNVSIKDFACSVIDTTTSKREMVRHWLNNVKVVRFFRQYARLLDQVTHLELEQEYWNCVIDTLSNTISWLSQMPKALTRQTSINWEYPRTEKTMKKRQKTISNQLKRAQENLNARLQKAKELPYPQIQVGAVEHTIISNAIDVFVQRGQQAVRTNFEQKKILLEIDRDEVQLVKSFYDLNPTLDQIEFALKIWRVTSKTRQQVTGQLNNHTIQNNNNEVTNDESKLLPKQIEQQNQLAYLKLFAPSIASIIEARRTNIYKRATHIMEFKKATPKQKSPRFHRTQRPRKK